jgi:hypothetical protein
MVLENLLVVFLQDRDDLVSVSPHVVLAFLNLGEFVVLQLAPHLQSEELELKVHQCCPFHAIDLRKLLLHADDLTDSARTAMRLQLREIRAICKGFLESKVLLELLHLSHDVDVSVIESPLHVIFVVIKLVLLVDVDKSLIFEHLP